MDYMGHSVPAVQSLSPSLSPSWWGLVSFCLITMGGSQGLHPQDSPGNNVD